MQISKNKKIHYPLLFIGLFIILALIGGIFFYKGDYFSRQQTTPQNDTQSGINYDEPTDEQIETGKEAKKEALENDSNPASSSSSINITSIHQSSDALQVRATVSPTSSQGVCTVSVHMSDSEIYSDTSSTQLLGSYSVCAGFDIPLSGLAKGAWTITIEYADSLDLPSSTTSQKVQVE